RASAPCCARSASDLAACWATPNHGRETTKNRPIRHVNLWNARDAMYAPPSRSSQSLFVQPGRVPAHDIIRAEKVCRVVALDVGVPGVVALQPGERQQRRVLFEYVIGLAHESLAPAVVLLTVNLWQGGVKPLVFPTGGVFRAS